MGGKTCDSSIHWASRTWRCLTWHSAVEGIGSTGVVLDGFVFPICLGVLLGWFGKKWKCGFTMLSGWWFFTNPFEKYARQIGSWNPKVRGENKKYLSCHHLALYSYFLRIFQQTPLEHTPRPSTTCLWRKSLHICMLGYLGLLDDTSFKVMWSFFFSFATLTSFLLDVTFLYGSTPPPRHLTVRHWKWAFFSPKGKANVFQLSLPGGWTNPSEKYVRQNGFIFPQVGVKINNIWVATT